MKTGKGQNQVDSPKKTKVKQISKTLIRPQGTSKDGATWVTHGLKSDTGESYQDEQ